MRIRQLVDDMLETMYAADGVGLAATQVDVHERVIVIDTSEARDDPLRADQPRADRAQRRDDAQSTKGCLSVPEIYDKVQRHARVTRACARPRRASRASSTPRACCRSCVQHEMDHLLGKVFVEYLSPLKRDAHQDAGC